MDDGPVLKFAAESGCLELVKYLYEVHHVNIEATGQLRGTQDTALSRACGKGHLDVAIYLISNGANPNRQISYGSVLGEAIRSRKLELVQELVRRGAKIDSWAIHYTLESGVYEISQFLLENNTDVVLSKGHINPFVQTAAKGGCVRTLKMLTDVYKLNLLEVGSISYRDRPQGYGIVQAAAESGSTDMVRYLAHECAIDIKSMVQTENTNKYAYQYRAYDTILGKAFGSKNLSLVKYLFEELELVPPQTALEDLKKEQAQFAGIDVNAYLESYLVQSAQEKQLLLQLSTRGLDGLNLPQLLVLYNLGLPRRGNSSSYKDEISAHINKKAPTVEEVSQLLNQNPRSFSIDLLCYFANSSSDHDFTPQIDTILRHDSSLINSANSRGNSPLHLTIAAKGYSATVNWLIQRGANPDLPNQEGSTAINMLGRMLGVGNQAIIDTLKVSSDYTNSLKQAVRDEHDRSLPFILKYSKGAIGSATARELLNNAIKTRGKLLELLRYVSDPIFNEMKVLLTNSDFMSSYTNEQGHISRTLVEAEKQRASNTDVRNPEREVVESAAKALFSISDLIGKMFLSEMNGVGFTPVRHTQENGAANGGNANPLFRL